METITLHKKKVVMCAVMVGVFMLGIGIGLVLGMHGGHRGRHGRGEYGGGYGDFRMGRGVEYRGSVMRINPPPSAVETVGQVAPPSGTAVGFEATGTTTRK
jgi:hypothetical protein